MIYHNANTVDFLCEIGKITENQRDGFNSQIIKYSNLKIKHVCPTNEGNTLYIVFNDDSHCVLHNQQV